MEWKDVIVILDASGTGQGPVAGFCEHVDELRVSLKAWNFLTH
jgi:hypothetical protein